MYKLMVIIPFLSVIALHGLSQQKASATASAVIVNPIGITMELVSFNPDNDIVLYNRPVNSQWKIQQVSMEKGRVSDFIQVIQIANLRVTGSNATMYDLILPRVLTLRNKTAQSFLQVQCYARKPNPSNETIGIIAGISIPSNQLLGKYVADENLTIIVNYN